MRRALVGQRDTARRICLTLGLGQQQLIQAPGDAGKVAVLSGDDLGQLIRQPRQMGQGLLQLMQAVLLLVHVVTFRYSGA